MRVSLPVFKYTFTPSWVMLLLALCAIGLFTRLGVWQIQRAHEKQQAIAAFDKQAANSVLDWSTTTKNPEQYQALSARGKYLPQVFFLDNQHQNHKFGYDVILPLLQENGEVVLVDRGWVAIESRDKEALPQVSIPAGNVEVTGNAYYPSKKGLILGEPLEKIAENIAIVETQDVTIFSKFLHKSVYPFIIRESENSAGPYVRNWQIVSMPPARHYGYAVQWFGLALVTFIIFISLNLKKQQ